MVTDSRPAAYWVFLVFLVLSGVLLLAGQTTAVFNYDLAVEMGLQEDVSEVTPLGVQMNRAFGVSDTLVYIPLIILSVVGLIRGTRWALVTTSAVMGISCYWTATIVFVLLFAPGTPGYSLNPGIEYWVILAVFFGFGLWGLWYLVFRGERLIVTDGGKRD